MGQSDLPLASGKKHQKVFESLGWILRRDASHITMSKPGVAGVTLSIPNHDEVKRGTLHSLVRFAGMTDREYRNAFDKL